MRTFLCLLIALFTPAVASAQLSAPERQIVRTVEAERGRHEALLQRMVDQNSGTLNLAGVRAVGEMIRPEFEALGMEVRWVDMSSTGRAGHLIAIRHSGLRSRATSILMIGHLDTVFEPSSPFQRFTRQSGPGGDRAVGPGVADDKGGVVVIIAALRALHASGLLDRMDVTVVLTGDEERPGSPIATARRDLIEAGRRADFALEFENLAREGTAEFGTTARRSSTSWTLTTRGRTGHSSGIFGEAQGYGAIYEMARILDAFRRELPEPNLTYNVGVIGGGTPATIDADGLAISASGKTNIIAETAIARGDIRTLSTEQEARVRARMQAIVRQHLAQTQAELVFAEDGYPAMSPTAGNRALLARLNEVNRDLGLPEMAEYDPARRGAADSSFVAADIDTIGGMGMAGGNAHAEGEWADLASLPRQAIRTAILMARLAGAGRR